MSPYEILSAEAYKNPLGELTRLFTEVMDLPGWRAELRKLENGLHRTKQTYMGKNPKDHKRILRELERMLAVGLILGEAYTDSQEADKVELLDLVEYVSKGEDFFKVIKSFPLNLHLDAVKFPRMHLRMISIDYSMDELLKMIRQWSEICLSKGKTDKFGSGDFNQRTYAPKLFKVVLQILECCHLIFVRGRKIEVDESLIVCPLPDEVKDAFGKIHNKFLTIPFPRWREIIAVIKKGIFDEKPVWYGSSPTEFLLIIDILKELVRLSEIVAFNYTQPDWLPKATFDSVLPKEVNRDVYEASFPFHFPLLLTEEHIQNPSLFLDGFLDRGVDEEKCIEFIDKCAMECLDCFQPMMFGFSQKKLDKLDDVLRMLEAIHLLLIRFDESQDFIIVKNI